MTAASQLDASKQQNNKEQAKKSCYSTSPHVTALQKISSLWLQGMIYVMSVMLSQVVHCFSVVVVFSEYLGGFF